MLLKLSILILLLTQSATSKEIEEHVEEFLKALVAVTTRSDDKLLAFKQLPQQLAHLMKVAVPIGAMGNVNTTLEPSSQEYKVFMDLQSRTKAIFQERNNRGTTEGGRNFSLTWQPSAKHIGRGVFKWNYTEEVTHPLAEMEFWTEKYLDPEWFKEDGDIRNYKKACLTSDTAPKRMLKHITYRLVTSCGAPVTSEEAKILTDHRAYLTKVLLKFRKGYGSFPDPGRYMTEFSSLYEQLLNKTVLNEKFDAFGGFFMTYDDAMAVFLQEIRHRTSVFHYTYEEQCLLHALIAVSNFNYVSVEAFLSRLINEITDLAYYAAICADVLYDGDARSIEVYTEGIIEDVNQIVTFALNYINESLVVAWPIVHQGVLSNNIVRTMHDNPKFTKQEIMKQVTNNTRSTLLHIGIPNYEYEIAMFHRDEKYQFYFNSSGDTDHCYSKQNEEGFDFVIGRISYNATDDTRKREIKEKISRLEKYVKKLDNIIKPAMDDMYAVDDIKAVAETLETKFGDEFLSEDNFHGWAISREWSYRHCPELDHYVSSYNLNELKSNFSIHYHNKGSIFEYCEEFKFFFFI